MEEMPANSKLAVSVRNRINKTVLMLNRGWKDLEEHLDFSKKSFEEANLELELRENDLNLIQNSVAETKESVELSRKSLEFRYEELDRREAELDLFQQEQVEYLRLREEQMENRFSDIKRRVEDRIDDGGFKEERMESKVNLMTSELDCVQEEMGSRSREFDEKEAIHEARFSDLETIQIQINKQFEDLYAEKQQHEELRDELLQRVGKAEVLMVKYRKRLKGLKLKEKVLEDRSKELDVLQKLNEEKGKELDSVEVSFNQSLEEFNLKEKQFKLDKEELDMNIKEFELKRKELAKKSKEIEQTQKSLEKHANEQRRDINSHVMVEKEVPFMSDSTADIHLTVTMNGKSLQLFLNENVNNHDSMHEEIIKVLQLSRDPATVILDAMEGFYSPHLTEEDNRLKISVVRKTCILLLQQLRKISPRIQSITKDRALKLAEEWKEKISLTDYDCSEALGLLNLLASYGLVSSFAANYILSLLEIAAEDNRVFELCGVPCFADKIPDLVERLIKKTKYVVAVRLFYKLDLDDKFSPVPLLRKHVHHQQNKPLNDRLASIEEVMKCIVEFGLQSQIPLRELKRSFEQLSRQKRSGNNEIGKHDDDNVVVVDNKVECDPSNDAHVSIVTCFLAMDGMCLLQFLSKHSMEFDLMKKYISKALKMSSDSGRTVIVGMKEFHGQNIPSCLMIIFIFVLEILVGNISIEIIKSQVVLDAAMNVAAEWKENLSLKKDPLYTLGFLQLVCTYKLTSKFDGDELYNFCCIVAEDCGGHVPKLSEILSSSEKVPVSKILNVDQEKINQSVLPTKAPQDSLPHGTVPDLFRLSSDPAKLLLDAMQFFFLSILKDDVKDGYTMEVFLPLLEELESVKVEIDTNNIKAEAYRFACEWKELLGLLTSGQTFSFLLYLSIYKLGSSFNDEEVLRLFIFCNNNSSSHLLRDFGLEKKMVEYIQNIVEKEEQFFEAINLIYTFELMKMLPPVPLLKKYLACAKEATTKICHQDQTPEVVVVAVEKEEEVVRAVIRCIVVNKLQSMFPPKPLQRRMKELAQEKKDAEQNVQRQVSPQSGGKKKRHAHLLDSELEGRRVKKVCKGVSLAAASTSK